MLDFSHLLETFQSLKVAKVSLFQVASDYFIVLYVFIIDIAKVEVAV